MFFNPLQSVENVLDFEKTVDGVERAAAQAVGGAFNDVLGLPQSLINTFYNAGGFIMGVMLMFIGGLLLCMMLFGDAVKDAAQTIGGGSSSQSATPTVADATEVATLV